jgi:hypothetical protein
VDRRERSGQGRDGKTRREDEVRSGLAREGDFEERPGVGKQTVGSQNETEDSLTLGGTRGTQDEDA